MSDIFKFNDHIMLVADYKDPEPHKHLAAHIIISLGQEMEWQIEQEFVKCRGICIAPNIIHSGKTFNDSTIVFMFTEISNYAFSLNQEHLHGKPYEVLNDNVIDLAIQEYQRHSADKDKMDSSILSACGITNIQEYQYDERVNEMLFYINELKTIDRSIVSELSNQICLSKSRLSHLFREQTGMTLHSYLAFEKLRKAYQYFITGKNITESCMMAGFDSPSHFASTCKRMFGISISDVYKTIATK